MRVLRLMAALACAATGISAAQLPAPQTQNLEKLLILTVPVESPSDSVAALLTIDVARDRLGSLARYKAMVVPKTKICEALTQSGFPCDALLSDQQAQQLAKALGVNSFNLGRVSREGGRLTATLRIISGAAGFATSFRLEAATPQALGEAIAQRLNTVIRAAEYARNCTTQRARNALDRALAEAAKAFAIEPNLAAANLCVATIREVQHAPPDSIIEGARRALKGDPGNSEAWNRVAQAMMVKGDTLGALTAYDSLLSYNTGDKNLRLGLAQMMLRSKRYADADRVTRGGLAILPGDPQLGEVRRRVCLEGATDATDAAELHDMSACVLEILRAEAAADSTKLADTTNLKLALGTAQRASDTANYLWWGRAAVTRYPTSVSFIKQLAAAFQLAGQTDSAVANYQRALAQNPSDVATSLLIAKAIVDNAVWDTAAARPLQQRNDTAALRAMRAPFVAKVDPARPYLTLGYASPDSAIRLTTAVVGLEGGSKLAQAGAYDAAYPWLDQLITQLAPRSLADTLGPRHAIRRQGSFWFGLSSALSLGVPYGAMVKDKSCDQARAINERIQRSLQALELGGAIAPGVAIQMHNILLQYGNQMPKVKQAFKCRNF